MSSEDQSTWALLRGWLIWQVQGFQAQGTRLLPGLGWVDTGLRGMCVLVYRQLCAHVPCACLLLLGLCVRQLCTHSGSGCWALGRRLLRPLRMLGAITPAQALPAPDNSHLLITLID